MELIEQAVSPRDDEKSAGHRSSCTRRLAAVLPSGADILFCAVLCAFATGRGAVYLLDDGDPGWHIRNGEHILATRSIPHVDYLSWTMAGHPWFSWEWLFDLIEGFLHPLGGLNAVLLLAALLIACSYRLLFQQALRRNGGDWLLAGAWTLLALGAGASHFLARPELASVLLTVVWLGWLEQAESGQAGFWRFPLTMLLWTNLHGGFIVGLMLLLVYAIASAWEGWFQKDQPEPNVARRQARRYGLCFLLCSAATLVNPYGWRLHLHIVHYLTDHYQLSHIPEFAPPDFHTLAGRCFEILVLTAAWLIFRSSRSVRAVDVLLMGLGFQLGLLAVRNLDLASIILVFAISGIMGRERWKHARCENGVGTRRYSWRSLSARLAAMEVLPRRPWLPFALLALAGWMVLHHGRMGGRQILNAHFGEKSDTPGLRAGFPVRAADAFAASGVPSHLFTTGMWAGYLIYRFYPGFHSFYDGRTDFFGDAMTRRYLRAILGEPGWQEVLNRERVQWVLLPPDLPLSALLRESPQWKMVYRDPDAQLFRRVPAAAAPGRGRAVLKKRTS